MHFCKITFTCRAFIHWSTRSTQSHSQPVHSQLLSVRLYVCPSIPNFQSQGFQSKYPLLAGRIDHWLLMSYSSLHSFFIDPPGSTIISLRDRPYRRAWWVTIKFTRLTNLVTHHAQLFSTICENNDHQFYRGLVGQWNLFYFSSSPRYFKTRSTLFQSTMNPIVSVLCLNSKQSNDQLCRRVTMHL